MTYCLAYAQARETNEDYCTYQKLLKLPKSTIFRHYIKLSQSQNALGLCIQNIKCFYNRVMKIQVQQISIKSSTSNSKHRTNAKDNYCSSNGKSRTYYQWKHYIIPEIPANSSQMLLTAAHTVLLSAFSWRHFVKFGIFLNISIVTSEGVNG